MGCQCHVPAREKTSPCCEGLRKGYILLLLPSLVVTVILKLLSTFQGRRRIARDANSIKKEIEEEKTEDKLKDNDTENKDVDDDCETAEKKENELLLGRKNTPKQKEKKIKKQEDSDKDSEEEEEKSQERYIILYLFSRSTCLGHSSALFLLRDSGLRECFLLGTSVPLV